LIGIVHTATWQVERVLHRVGIMPRNGSEAVADGQDPIDVQPFKPAEAESCYQNQRCLRNIGTWKWKEICPKFWVIEMPEGSQPW